MSSRLITAEIFDSFLKCESKAYFSKRPKLAVLTADYVNEANSEARFQGKRSSMRLTGWSAIRVSTSRK